MLNSKVLILKLNGDFDSGFKIDLEIFSSKNESLGNKSGELPSNRELLYCLKYWQQEHHKLGLRREIKVKKITYTRKDMIPQPNKVRKFGEELKKKFNQWLNSPKLNDINLFLRENIDREELGKIIICSNEQQIDRLPWDEWNFLECYNKCSVVFSPINFQYKRDLKPQKFNYKIRILAIFGNSKNLNTTKDLKVLHKLPNAKIVYLKEPSRKELNQSLRAQSWDIIFFAGHSKTIHGEGIIALNSQDTLTINEIKYALKEAIDRGLQLAIFNSCDGLGLAYELVKLSLPNTIVMREPIPDSIAQDFLKYFLEYYSRGNSLAHSIKQAKENLQEHEEKFPFSSWLPVLYQPRSINSPLWSELYGVPKKSLTEKLLVMVISIIVSNLAILVQPWGLFQFWELKTFDFALNLQVPKKVDERILVITIDDEDIAYQDGEKMERKGSLSDRALAQLLDKLKPYKPRVIASDIIHDFPYDPEFKDRIITEDNFFSICRIGEYPSKLTSIASPQDIPQNRLGFSDLVIDPDGVIRRQLIGMSSDRKCQTSLALSLRIALTYLNNYSQERDESGTLKIKNIPFKRIKQSSGAYQLPSQEEEGYQILLNYNFASPKTISLREIIQEKKDSELASLVSDKIILIGVTTPNHDLFHTPYSKGKFNLKVPGVIIHAQGVSSILSIVLDDERPLSWVKDELEYFWIFSWSLIGGAIVLFVYNPQKRKNILLLLVFSLMAFYILLLLFYGYWLPLISPALASICSFYVNTIGKKIIVND